MSATLAPAVPTPAPPEPGQRVVIPGLAWADYEAVGAALADRPNLRLTYDRGRLEVMTLSPEHERLKYLFGRLIDTLAEERGVRIGGFGSTTYKSEDAGRGLEPDQCYYLARLAAVRGKRRIDLTVDPPPDLVVEIDVTRSSLDRLAAYAALGVPEVWRYTGAEVLVYRLTAAGGYDVGRVSSLFGPNLDVNELTRFVRIGEVEDDTAMVRQFRQWVRQ